MAAVRLDQLRKVYPNGNVGVAGASFDIADGELLVLVGPSGCGKTTLLRMIAGLESISAGTLSIDGRVVNEVAPKDRDIAMVFQNYALYPHMTVAENLGFGLRLRGHKQADIDQRVAAAAKTLGLDSRLAARPAALSGGQRQRVALGRALVRDPKVFLLDEPLSNLDAKLRLSMRVEIARLHRQLKATMIYVTHDQIEAMTLGQRIVVLDGGVIQQIDTPMNLYERPANLFVAGFVGSPAMNLLRGRVRDGSAVAGDLVVPAPGVPDGEVFVGVRPESLQPARNGMPSLGFEVAVVEPLGDEVIVHGFVGAEVAEVSKDEGDAALVAATGNGHRAEAVACLPPRDRPAEGSVIQLGVEPEEVHLFDAQTGLAIRRG